MNIDVTIHTVRDGIRETFKDCGEIVDIRLATDPKKNNALKGFGHVSFANSDSTHQRLR